jgi:hypothetical protein
LFKGRSLLSRALCFGLELRGLTEILRPLDSRRCFVVADGSLLRLRAPVDALLSGCVFPINSELLFNLLARQSLGAGFGSLLSGELPLLDQQLAFAGDNRRFFLRLLRLRLESGRFGRGVRLLLMQASFVRERLVTDEVARHFLDLAGDPIGQAALRASRLRHDVSFHPSIG